MTLNRYLLITASAALMLGAVLAVPAQHGLIDSYETDPAATNFYGGANGFFSGGGGGGGAGELAGNGVGGSTGVNGGAGGDFGAGLFYGYAHDLNGAVDTTVSFAGMTTTGIGFDFRDQQFDGDTFGLRAESGGFANSTTWHFTASAVSAFEAIEFDFTDPPQDVQGSGASPAAITNVVFVGVNFNGGNIGDATFDFDNLRFIGNNVPNTGAVEDYESDTPGVGGATNAYGGITDAFQFGGTVVSNEVVAGQAYRIRVTDTQTPVRGGWVVSLLPVAGTVDLSAYQSVEFEISSVDADDTFAVQVETADSTGAPAFWSSLITPPAGTTLYRIAFDQFTGGPGASLDPTQVRQVSFVHTGEGAANNAFDVTIDNVGFSVLVPVELSVFSAE